MTDSLNTTPIVQVGAIGDPRVADGRLIPFLTVDCSKNKGLEHFIEIQSSTPTQGDVVSKWGWKRFDKSHVFLQLSLTRLVEAQALLAFPVMRLGNVVEWIVATRGFYIQSSKYGSSVSEGWGKPAALIEVTPKTSFPVWEGIYRRSLKKKFKHQGLTSQQIKDAIQEYRQRQRELWFRKIKPKQKQ